MNLQNGKRSWRHWLMPSVSILCIVLAALWWFGNMRRVSKAEHYVSEIAVQNPMLAAERFLRAQGVQVRSEETLDLALESPLRSGALLIAERGGVITPTQGNKLLRWVAGGGVLILPAGEQITEEDDEEDKSDIGGSDPISVLVKTGLADTRGKAGTETVSLPTLAYPLRISGAGRPLQSRDDAPPLAWGDADSNAIRAFSHGRGQIVLFNWNRFNNDYLAHYDNAELLLNLSRLPGGTGSANHSLFIVRNLSMPTWYAALWRYFAYGIAALGLLLLFMLWRALPRFGPLLPEAQTTRRALMEHVDASARWHWREPAGRKLLLSALRSAVLARVHRREPGLQRLDRATQLTRLSTQYTIDRASLERALYGEAADHPVDFTRQIQTLQTLRKNHER